MTDPYGSVIEAETETSFLSDLVNGADSRRFCDEFNAWNVGC